jgi:ArsR family transcriptional regulator
MSKYKNIDTGQIAELFKALGNQQRLNIFLKLAESCCQQVDCDPENEGVTVSTLAAGEELALSTVSHHLRELMRAGLINKSKSGKSVYCCINEEQIRYLQDILGQVIGPAESTCSIGE